MISREVAEFIHQVSGYALVIGVVVTLLATVGQLWSDRVREHYQALDLAEADERISAAGEISISAREAAIIAEERARAAEAELLELRTPRSIDASQRRSIVASLERFAGQTFSGSIFSGAWDGRIFWADIVDLLEAAGWIRLEPAGLAAGNPRAIAYDSCGG